MQSTMISSFLLFFFIFFFSSSTSISDQAFFFSLFFYVHFCTFPGASHRDDSRRCNAACKHITKCSWFPVRQAMRLQYHRPYRYDILRTNRETNEEQKLTIMLLQNFMPCTQSFTIRYNLHFLPSFLAKRFELDRSLFKFTSLQDVFPVRHSTENSNYFNFRVHVANRSLERARKRIPSRYL